MAQRRTVWEDWWTVCLLALNRRTDVLTFSYSYYHLLTIRIRIVILSAARFARSPTEHVGAQYNTAWTRCKGSERSERR
jgi:hypothetical protein